MRILSIHADRMWYRATKKTKMAEQITEKEDCMEECVVLFCCVEKLDEKNPAHVIESAKQSVLVRLEKLKVDRVLIYPYAHLTSTLGSPAVSLEILTGLEKALKDEGITVKRLVQAVRDPGQGSPSRRPFDDHLPVRGNGVRLYLPVLPPSLQGGGCGARLSGGSGMWPNAGRKGWQNPVTVMIAPMKKQTVWRLDR